MAGLLEKLMGGGSDFLRLARFFDPTADPWARIPMDVPVQAFGLASNREFCRYLEGVGRVVVQSVDDICRWLRECEALADEELFVQPDYWQHPVTFEHLRKGDCEDHSLWAWRQLLGLGLPTLFVAGLWQSLAHTWVLFEQAGETFLLESTAKDASILQPLAAVRGRYCPALAVDGACQTYVFQGYQHFHATFRPPPSRPSR